MKNLFNSKNKKTIILFGIIFIVLILVFITIFIFSNKQNLNCKLVKTDDPNVYIANNFYVEYNSNNTYSLLGLTKSADEVSIPNTINKIPVTRV